MERKFDDLNEMKFNLPKGWAVSGDVYSLPNGQGMINKENYISKDGDVISFFAVHRDPDDFFSYYDSFLGNISKHSQKYNFVGKYNIRLNDFVFPTYVLKGIESEFYSLQTFINCADCLGCFMVSLKSFDGDIKAALKKERILASLVEMLRSVE